MFEARMIGYSVAIFGVWRAPLVNFVVFVGAIVLLLAIARRWFSRWFSGPRVAEE